MSQKAKWKLFVLFSMSLILVQTIVFYPSIGAQAIVARPTRAENSSLDTLPFYDFRTYRESDLLYRVAFGDILPERPGHEMATCSRNGVVAVTYGSDVSWATEIAKRTFIDDNPNDPAQVYSIAVADLLKDDPGDEIVTVDMDYCVNIIWKTDGKWNSRTIWNDTDWLYEVAVGNIFGSGNDDDIVVVADHGRATLLTRNEGGWSPTLLFKDSVALDSCFIDDIDPSGTGSEVIVGGNDKNLTMISKVDGKIIHTDIASTNSPIIDILTTDLDPTIGGKEIYAATYNGNLYEVWREGNEWKKKVVHQEGTLIYGIESGIVDGDPVISIATWKNRIGLIYYTTDFKFREIYKEDYILIGTGIFDIDPTHKENEVMALSGLGQLTMLYHDDPGVDIVLPFTEVEAFTGENLTIPFIIRAKGDFNGTVRLSASGLEATLTDNSIETRGASSLDLNVPSIPGNYEVILQASMSRGTITSVLKVTALSGDRKLGLSRSIFTGELGADRQFTGSFLVLSNGDLGSPFVFRPIGLPKGIGLPMEESICDPLGEPIPISFSITCESWVIPDRYMFFLIGSSNNDPRFSRALVFEINIRERYLSDFRIDLSEKSLEIPLHGNNTLKVTAISINGFNGEVALSVPEEVEGLSFSFSETVIVPTGDVVLRIDLGNDEGPFFVRVIGRSGNLTRETYLAIHTLPPKKDLILSGPLGPIVLKEKDGIIETRFNVILTPVGGPLTSVKIMILGLPEDFSATIFPVDLQIIPYEVNLTIVISGPARDLDAEIVLNITSESILGWEQLLSLEYQKVTDSDDHVPFWLILLILVVIFVPFIGAILLIVIKRTNLLNHVEGVPPDNGKDRGAHRDRTPFERRHGRSGSLDRLGHPKK